MTAIDLPIPTTRRMTADDLLRSSDNAGVELVDGQALEKPVSAESSQAELWIGTRLTLFTMVNPVAFTYGSSMGFQVFQHVEPGDPDRVRKPDLSVIRTERVNQLVDPDPGHMPIVPDLAVEVVSLNDVWSDLVDKVHEYHAAGFPLVWIADPGFRTVTAYPLGGEPTLFSSAQTITAGSALPGFSCRVADLFPPTLPAGSGSGRS